MGVSLQPGRAGDIVDKKANKIFQGRFVYNTVMNVSDVQTANRALHLIWKQWLTGSNMCKPLVPGRTFADVDKQNAYSHNNSFNISRPLGEMQAVSRQGKLPGSVKEANLSSSTVSPQGHATHIRSCKDYTKIKPLPPPPPPDIIKQARLHYM